MNPAEQSPAHDALLIVGFGGPEKREDVIPFLENVLRGRNVPRERMLQVAEHYDHFGGVSPINGQIRELIDALTADLRAHGVDLPVYWGNRNWHPMLADTMQRMKTDGVRHALAVVVAAYSSYSSCRQYREDIGKAQEAVGAGAPTVDKMRVFYNHPGFIAANADRVRDALKRSESGKRESGKRGQAPRRTSEPVPFSNASLHRLFRRCADTVGDGQPALGGRGAALGVPVFEGGVGTGRVIIFESILVFDVQRRTGVRNLCGGAAAGPGPGGRAAVGLRIGTGHFAGIKPLATEQVAGIVKAGVKLAVGLFHLGDLFGHAAVLAPKLGDLRLQDVALVFKLRHARLQRADGRPARREGAWLGAAGRQGQRPDQQDEETFCGKRHGAYLDPPLGAVELRRRRHHQASSAIPRAKFTLHQKDRGESGNPSVVFAA